MWQKVSGEQVNARADELVQDLLGSETTTKTINEVLAEVRPAEEPKKPRGRPAKKNDDSFVDQVNSPPHYTSGGIETIDFIEAKNLSYHLGNVIKYVSRAELKGRKLQDLEKAAWYLSREINRLKGQN